jgi:hypothetical protein
LQIGENEFGTAEGFAWCYHIRHNYLLSFGVMILGIISRNNEIAF